MGACCQTSKSPKHKGGDRESKSSKNNKSREFSVSTSDLVRLIKGSVTDKYEIVRAIGDGGFGQVKLGRHKETKLERAIKFIPLSSIDKSKITQLMEEVNILKKLDHPNIIKIFEVYQDEKYLSMVTELCTGGELFDRIKELDYFSENQAAKYMFDTASAIKYCHEAGIVHRDLKPENLLLENKTPTARLKLIDFGTSQEFNKGKKMKKFIGTSYYVAPEVINGSYDQKCDVWSLGVILYIMLSGTPPFNGPDDDAIYANILKRPLSFSSSRWNFISKEAKDLIKLMLNKNPEKRIDIGEVYNHPWIQSRANNRVPDQPIAKESLQHLSNFHIQNRLQRATMTFIVSQIVSSDELANLRDIFQTIDENGDGRLSREELQNGFSKFPMFSGVDVDELMNQCDADGNGYVDYTEFLTAATNWTTALSRDRLQTAFKIFDKDGNGKISLDELKQALGGNEDNETVFMKMITDADRNGDGEIDLDEFTEMMMATVNTPNEPSNRI